jgi:hypothetical protein
VTTTVQELPHAALMQAITDQALRPIPVKSEESRARVHEIGHVKSSLGIVN